MTALWNILVANTNATTLIVAAIAVIGVLLSALVSALVSRRATYISSVTAERSKWIDKLRANISELVGELGYLHYQVYQDENYVNSEQYDEIIRRVEALVTVVRLQLNPMGNIDSNIIKLLAVMTEMFGNQEYRNLENLFVRHVQWLLKVEWEKVKFEARGLSRYFWGWPKQIYYQYLYRRFSEGEGSIRSFVKESD